MNKPYLFALLLATSIAASAQDSLVTHQLDDIEITGSSVLLTRKDAPRLVTIMDQHEIKQAGVQSINDLLEYAIGIDCRQRGEMGVQTDISVRGGTFDQVSILLNGINISSPHTGHLSADFPVSIDDIERIEVMEGPAARVFGTQAFTGVINIITRQEENGGVAHIFAGMHNTYGGNMRISKSHGAGKGTTMTHHLSGGYTYSDGATPNSHFQNGQVFYQNHLIGANYSIDAQLGYSYKPYGANTFYGASSKDQWESNERIMAAVKAQAQLGIVHIAPKAYWNRWYDHYQWHQGKTAGENYHQVDSKGLALNADVQWVAGKTALGVEVRQEGIYSTNLGLPIDTVNFRKLGGHDRQEGRFYTKHDKRTNVAIFLEHNVLLRDWTISLGVLGNYNSGLDNKMRFYPGLDVSYRPNDDWKIYLSYNMSLRMPTFTDLYYRGTGYAGTVGLKPEKSQDVSLGATYRHKGVQAMANVFYSHKDDLIDWVVYANDTLTPNDPNDRIHWTYRSGNFRLNNIGVELQASWLPQEIWPRCPLRKLTAQYAYLHEDINYPEPILSSKYAMEYLRHKVVLQADVNIWKQLGLSLTWRYQDRIGDNNKPYNLLDARIAWDAPRWMVYVDGTNLCNVKYYDYSFVEQPGIWVRGGFKWRW